MSQSITIEKVTDGISTFKQAGDLSFFYYNEDVCCKLGDGAENNAINWESKEIVTIESNSVINLAKEVFIRGRW